MTDDDTLLLLFFRARLFVQFFALVLPVLFFFATLRAQEVHTALYHANTVHLGLGALTFDGAEPNIVFSGAYTRRFSSAWDIRAGMNYYAGSNITQAAQNRPLVNPPLSLLGTDDTVWGSYSRSLVFGELSAGWRPFHDGLRLSGGVAVRHLVQVFVSEVWNQVPIANQQTGGQSAIAIWGSRYSTSWNVGIALGVEYDIVLAQNLSLTLYAKHHNYGTVRNSLTFSAGAAVSVRF